MAVNLQERQTLALERIASALEFFQKDHSDYKAELRRPPPLAGSPIESPPAPAPPAGEPLPLPPNPVGEPVVVEGPPMQVHEYGKPDVAPEGTDEEK